MTVDEILQQFLYFVPDKYDVSVGSFFYDLLYPVAEFCYNLWNKEERLESNTYALTATGEHLDSKVAEQNVIRQEAGYSKGIVKISGTRGAIIRAGALVAADTTLFSVDEAATIPECGYVEVSATCTTAGTSGNVKTGEINRFPVTLPGITEVKNLAAFNGGYAAESDEDLRERYLEKVSRPNASGNAYQYEEWAKEVAGVGGVRVIPLWNGNGTVKVVITDTENRPASAELISKVKEYIEQNRPVGAAVTVVSAASLVINVSVSLNTNTGDFDTSIIETAITKYLSSIALDKQYVSIAKIGSIILAADGVEDYSDLKINNTTDNISLSEGVIPVLGEVRVI